MTNWIVQSSPKQYDQDHPKFLAYWNMTRYSLKRRRREIRPGDHVAVWISGPDGGVVAFAEIGDGEPFQKELREEDGWLPGNHLGERRWHWPLVNARRLDQPILKSPCWPTRDSRMLFSIESPAENRGVCEFSH